MSAAPRLALFYATAFGFIGIYLPFWPLFLAGRGLGAEEIGIVLGSTQWLKIVANPAAGILADRSAGRHRVMAALAAINLASLCLFLPAQGFALIFLLNAVLTPAASALLPLGDNLAVTLAHQGVIDYGRVRLWGSLAFIVTALGAGRLIAGRASEIVLPLLIAGAALNLLACLALPAQPHGDRAAARRGWTALLLDRRQLVFLLAAVTIQASHAVYYVFGTLQWSGLGFSGTEIGILWAEGVVAEIVLFACGARLVARLGPTRLLLFGGLAAILRWGLTAFAAALPLLLALQLLHALTFGAAHLGAMGFLARALPAGWSATGQALYSAVVGGLGFGLVMALSGPLYASVGALAYLAMAALGAVGALAAWRLGRMWQGERLAE